MADELGISKGALRGRAHQIRKQLEECVGNAWKISESKQNTPPEA
jgi:DNA-directed RNA polymerase specialized sigma24 family protein